MYIKLLLAILVIIIEMSVVFVVGSNISYKNKSVDSRLPCVKDVNLDKFSPDFANINTDLNYEQLLQETIRDYPFNTIIYNVNYIEENQGVVECVDKEAHKNHCRLKEKDLEGGNCVKLSEILLEKVVSQGKTAWIILSTLPSSHLDHGVKSSDLAHAAVLVKDGESLILLDPGFPIVKPIFLNEVGSNYIYKADFSSWIFKRHLNKIESFLIKGNDREPFYYDLTKLYSSQDVCILNQMVTLPCISHSSKLSIVRNDMNGYLQASLSLNLSKNRIEASYTQKTGRRYLSTIDIDDFVKNGVQSWSESDRNLMNFHLKVDLDNIVQKIKFLIKNRHRLPYS